MPRPRSPFPTHRELEILKLLWAEGPLTVSEVRSRLDGVVGTEPAHTSVMTVMGTMVTKGYLNRTRQGNGYLYRAAVERSSTTGRMLRDLIGRAFDGATATVAIGLLEESDLDRKQLEALRVLIDRKAPLRKQ